MQRPQTFTGIIPAIFNGFEEVACMIKQQRIGPLPQWPCLGKPVLTDPLAVACTLASMMQEDLGHVQVVSGLRQFDVWLRDR